MILFIEIAGAPMKADRAFCKLFGEDAVGWVGRNVKPREVRAGLKGRRFKLLGGRLTLAMAADVEGISLVTTLLSDPLRRANTEWRMAEERPEHPHHAAPHTLTMGEVIDERHPFRPHLCNVATRSLVPRGAKLIAREVMAELSQRPSLIGHVDHRGPYVHALAALMDVPSKAVDARGFRPTLKQPPRHDVDTIATANRQDARLLREVAARAGDTHVWRSNL